MTGWSESEGSKKGKSVEGESMWKRDVCERGDICENELAEKRRGLRED